MVILSDAAEIDSPCAGAYLKGPKVGKTGKPGEPNCRILNIRQSGYQPMQ